MNKAIEMLEISSPAFQDGDTIPKKYSCDGEKVSPPFAISTLPDDTQSLVLISEDPDTAKGIFDHWLCWNIEPRLNIEEGENPGISGKNSAGKNGYYPPCPPSGKHRYYFDIYALDTLLDLDPDTEKPELQEAMRNHILAKGSLMGFYSR